MFICFYLSIVSTLASSSVYVPFFFGLTKTVAAGILQSLFLVMQNNEVGDEFTAAGQLITHLQAGSWSVTQPESRPSHSANYSACSFAVLSAINLRSFKVSLPIMKLLLQSPNLQTDNPFINRSQNHSANQPVTTVSSSTNQPSSNYISLSVSHPASQPTTQPAYQTASQLNQQAAAAPPPPETLSGLGTRKLSCV